MSGATAPPDGTVVVVLVVDVVVVVFAGGTAGVVVVAAGGATGAMVVGVPIVDFQPGAGAAAVVALTGGPMTAVTVPAPGGASLETQRHERHGDGGQGERPDGRHHGDRSAPVGGRGPRGCGPRRRR